MNEDYRIIELIESKIEHTTGEEQETWVEKYDIFTNRNLFKEHNQVEKLKEVDKIRAEALTLIG